MATKRLPRLQASHHSVQTQWRGCFFPLGLLLLETMCQKPQHTLHPGLLGQNHLLRPRLSQSISKGKREPWLVWTQHTTSCGGLGGERGRRPAPLKNLAHGGSSVTKEEEEAAQQKRHLVTLSPQEGTSPWDSLSSL